MDIEKTLRIMQQLAALTGTVAELIAEAKQVASSDDEAALKAGLADLQKRNDEAFQRVSDKLKAAAQR